MRKIKEITKTAKISIVYPDNDGSIYTVKNLNRGGVIMAKNVLATRLLRAELEKLGIETDIGDRNEDDLLSLRLKFPSGAEFDLQPDQDYCGEDGMPIIDVKVSRDG